MHSVELASRISINLITAMIWFYQKFISPLTGANCRFYPSCSEYSLQSFKAHGIFKGLIKTVIRIAKCHPFHPGGYDPVH